MDLTVAHIDSEYKIGYDLTRELLEETRDITAIVGLNDMIAFGILDALQEEKIRVPAEMSVMGCDNSCLRVSTKWHLPPLIILWCIRGRDARDIIMKKIDSRDTQYADWSRSAATMWSMSQG